MSERTRTPESAEFRKYSYTLTMVNGSKYPVVAPMGDRAGEALGSLLGVAYITLGHGEAINTAHIVHVKFEGPADD